jgi:hypothetical protein
MNREKKCLNNPKCVKEYNKCIKIGKNGKPLPINYWRYQELYNCQHPILEKYYPRKKSVNYNPDHRKCSEKCNKKNPWQRRKSKKKREEYNNCNKECNKKYPKWLRYKYGKLVNTKTEKSIKKVKKVKKVKKSKKKSKWWIF